MIDAYGIAGIHNSTKKRKRESIFSKKKFYAKGSMNDQGRAYMGV